LELTSNFNGHSPISWWLGEWAVHRRNPHPDRFVDSMANLQVVMAKNMGMPSWTPLAKEEMWLPLRAEAKNHPLCGRAFDVLFVNSWPLSGQCIDFDMTRMNRAAVSLAAKGLKVVTTHPCPGVDTCTTDLGELATRCQNVVGVANAPFIATLNQEARKSVKLWVNYSTDFLNFDHRSVWARTIQEFEEALEALATHW
jgi:hypothetical protein